MDESMCPCYYDCLKYIMKLLNDTEYEYAKEWRKRVNRKIKVGDKIKFDNPITFENGETINTFTYRGKCIFESGNKLYRITKYKNYSFKIILNK